MKSNTNLAVVAAGVPSGWLSGAYLRAHLTLGPSRVDG